jgi:Spy/CpxP family protein refolding chaperone
MRHTVVALLAAATLGLPAGVPGQPPARQQAPAEVRDRIRQRFARLLRERVGLSDDQLRRLAPISRGFDARRQTLFREERAVRQALRRELGAASPDQARIAAQIDQLFALQRRRLDLAAEEQRELATFMTPAQRARYLALQEHLRRRAEEMRRRRGGGPPRGAGRRAPPGRSPGF